MISDAADQAASNHRASRAQDKRVPFLIHVDDARLLPNTPLTRKNPSYRQYHGDAKAPLEERKRYLATEGAGRGAPRRAVVGMSQDVEAPFDIGAASKAELVAFAMTEYSTALSDDADIRTLRKQVAKLAETAAALG